MRMICGIVLAGLLSAIGTAAEPGRNLVKNPRFLALPSDPTKLGDYALSGNAAYVYAGRRDEFADHGVALDSAKGGDGAVSTDVAVDPGVSRWYRFSFRGLPEKNFALSGDD